MFELHTQLAKDCILLGDMELSRVLLMNDANYPWVILVPRRENIREMYQLSKDDQQILTRESAFLASTMATLFNAEKMNVAALGNMVPQLHIHHIARNIKDPAWPKPVWGTVPAAAYEEDERHRISNALIKALHL